MHTILRWADGTWINKEDYREADYQWLSDDYEEVELSDEEYEELL